MSNEFTVLRALRLKGRAGPEDLAAATGLEPGAVSAIVGQLLSAGEAREVAGAYMLLPAGREHEKELLAEERAGVDTDTIAAVYEDFTDVNGDFKQLASDWQLRDGEPNDHSDSAYDQGVLARLPDIHARVSPVVERASAAAPRLQAYGRRLDTALERVQTGDHAWLLKPLIDSYHTVWFELHEELIALAGLSREAEAASGRAE